MVYITDFLEFHAKSLDLLQRDPVNVTFNQLSHFIS